MVIKGEEKIITSADNRNIELTENSKQKGEKVTCHISVNTGKWMQRTGHRIKRKAEKTIHPVL